MLFIDLMCVFPYFNEFFVVYCYNYVNCCVIDKIDFGFLKTFEIFI